MLTVSHPGTRWSGSKRLQQQANKADSLTWDGPLGDNTQWDIAPLPRTTSQNRSATWGLQHWRLLWPPGSSAGCAWTSSTTALDAAGPPRLRRCTTVRYSGSCSNRPHCHVPSLSGTWTSTPSGTKTLSHIRGSDLWWELNISQVTSPEATVFMTGTVLAPHPPRAFLDCVRPPPMPGPTPTHSHAHTYTRALSFSPTRTHTHTLSPSPSLSVSLSRTHTRAHALCRTHTHTHVYASTLRRTLWDFMLNLLAHPLEWPKDRYRSPNDGLPCASDRYVCPSDRCLCLKQCSGQQCRRP